MSLLLLSSPKVAILMVMLFVVMQIESSSTANKPNNRKCLFPCPKIYLPVCGTNGVTYSNECMLRVAKCKSSGKIKFDYNGRCQRPRIDCSKPCPFYLIARPVCGNNGVTYPNECLLNLANCTSKRKIFKVYEGPCLHKVRWNRRI